MLGDKRQFSLLISLLGRPARIYNRANATLIHPSTTVLFHLPVANSSLGSGGRPCSTVQAWPGWFVRGLRIKPQEVGLIARG